MDITSDILPDSLYYPLPPSVSDVLTYASELEEEGNNINFKWADYEIKNHLLSYVKVGLVAQRVRFYRLWRHAQENFKNFKEYCEKGLGKSYWVIKKIIEAARVTLELAQAGFTQLPQYEAQARPLTKFTGDTLIEKWQEVISSAPAHRITATYVSEIVDGEPQNPKKRISLNKDVYDELVEKARTAGKKPDELLRELLGNYDPTDDYDYEPETQTEIVVEDEPEKTEEPENPLTQKELENWLLDMKNLLAEHYGLSFSPSSNSS